MRGEIQQLDVEYRGQAAESLGADAQCVDLLEDLQARLLEPVRRPAFPEFVDVDRVHQRTLGHQHGLLGRPSYADAKHARRAPSRTHRRHRFQNPVDDAVCRVQILRPAWLFRGKFNSR